MFQYAEVGDTVYFWFATHNTSGSAADATTPLCDVREAGAASSAAPVLSPTPALLSHASYGPGIYEVAVAATTGNGFAGDKVYMVTCTATVDLQNPAGIVGAFRLSRKDIGAGLSLIDTTIATLSSQTSFTLTDGSGDDDAYNGCVIVVTDSSTAVQKAIGLVSDYTGSTKTITLHVDPGVFTMATGDKVEILASHVNLRMINSIDITGNGSGTPFNV